mmetsp:Transcript_37744/g.120300  ORF Transcript_37744/g.120300 Transcript_37744/m.120300 type:complete len:249 (+) Transcript_37744:2176-2922(+)
MALATELIATVHEPLSEESSGQPYGEVIRDYEPLADTRWRFGTPNYARVNKLYFQHRSKIHREGSLESIVNKLVKNWEVESHHIANPKQWKTMDITKFQAMLNGGTPANAQLMADIGPYSLLIGETADYSAAAVTFDESNKIFGSTFADGFAWECTEVLSGPPTVMFKWHHFGTFSGMYTDKKGRKFQGDGSMCNVYGMCIAKVSDKLVIESLDVYYNPDDLLKPLVTNVKRGEGDVCVGRDEADSKQ